MMLSLQDQQIEAIRNKSASQMPYDQETIENYHEMEQSKREVLENMRSPTYKSPLRMYGKFDFTKELALDTNQKSNFGQTFELNMMDEMVESCDQYLNLATAKKQKSPSPKKYLQQNLYNFNVNIKINPQQPSQNPKKNNNPCDHAVPMKFINPTPSIVLKNGLIIDEALLSEAINKNYDSDLSFSNLINQQFAIKSCKQTIFKKAGLRYLSIQLEAKEADIQSLQYTISRFNSFTNKEYKFIAENLQNLEMLFKFAQKSMFSNKNKQGSKSSQSQGLQQLKNNNKLYQSDMIIYQYSLDSPNAFKDLEYLHINEKLLKNLGYSIQECQKQIGQQKILPDLCYLNHSPQYLDFVKKQISSAYKQEKPAFKFKNKQEEMQKGGDKIINRIQGMNSYSVFKVQQQK